MSLGMQRGRILPLGAGRGRVIGARAATAAPLRASRRSSVFLLMLVLPLFAQVFHYMIDSGPIYYLSKAWPVLMLPLAAYGVSLRVRFAALYLVTLTYVLAVTPVLSMLWLGNDLLDAAANSIKVWPLTYYFSLIALLTLRHPDPDEIVDALVRLGVATLAVMWLLWLVVPSSAYTGDYQQSKLFIYEYERGDRIFFPMSFAILAMFYAAERLRTRFNAGYLLLILAVLATQLLVFKQRTILGASVVVLGLLIVARLPKLIRSGFLAVGLLAGMAGLYQALLHVEQIAGKFGNSLAIRERSLSLLETYLAQQPLRWIFGTGAASRVGSVNMAEIIGRKDFFLADLGWAGVVFEFGLVGAMLLAALYWVALRESLRLPPVADPRHRAMLVALGGYVLFLALTTLVYSVVYAPGELAATTALLVYLGKAASAEAAA